MVLILPLNNSPLSTIIYFRINIVKFHWYMYITSKVHNYVTTYWMSVCVDDICHFYGLCFSLVVQGNEMITNWFICRYRGQFPLQFPVNALVIHGNVHDIIFSCMKWKRLNPLKQALCLSTTPSTFPACSPNVCNEMFSFLMELTIQCLHSVCTFASRHSACMGSLN